ncbi:MAG: PASTA domain-containing protein, partial [Clostridiales bacterium]|nr:PASTA domain-containing protein [Clostridiales bacterium]
CGFETDVKRYYPYSTFASNLIGMVEEDDNSVGQTGIEAYYNTDLKGVNGRKTSYGSRTDDSGSVYEAINGNNLYLTIDSSIQYALDEQLKAVYKSSGGIGAYGIVMDVDTGALLAMDGVGYKGNYDLNNRYALNDYYSKCLERELQKEEEDCRYLSKADIEILDRIENPDERENTKRSIIKKNMQTGMWNNYCVSELYYPGSVFKPFLASAAVEEQVLGDDYKFCCNGQIAIEDRVFHCHQLRGHGWQNLKEGLMNSCNPFFISVGRKLGREKFFNYFEAFGFTEKTGIDILSEEGGSTVNYYTVDKLGAVELASESFGQSFRVTPIQMITALSAIANGGKLMKPYIVAKQTDSQGNVIHETTPVVKRQVISESTAEQVGEMMEAVVTGGTGRNGYVAGYRVAGKTGTTQKENMKGLYIASFGCFAPVDDPKIAVLIIVNEPQGEINGSTVCAPVAAKVVEQTLEYLGVEREYTEKELEKLDTQTPGLIGMDISAAKEKLEKGGFKFKVVGEGDTVVSQNPAGGHTIPQHGAVVIYTESDSEAKMVMVPDFNTMTPNRAKNYALEEGLNIKIVGNTTGTVYAYDQSIPAESEVEYGSTVTVYFKTTTGVNDFAG